MSSAELSILWGLGAVCLCFTLRMHLFLVAVNKQYLMGRRQSVEAFHLFSVSMFIINNSGHKPVSHSLLNVLVTRKRLICIFHYLTHLWLAYKIYFFLLFMLNTWKPSKWKEVKSNVTDSKLLYFIFVTLYYFSGCSLPFPLCHKWRSEVATILKPISSSPSDKVVASENCSATSDDKAIICFEPYWYILP